MKRSVPLLPTIAVAIAVATMVALGLWQLDRRAQKAALVARAEANAGQPLIALPLFPDIDALMFRRVSVQCLSAGDWSAGAGRAADGSGGFRHIAECRTGGAEGPGVRVEMGVTSDPKFRPDWTGGAVTGTLTTAPVATSALSTLFGRGEAPTPMVVAETPAPGLKASRRPDPASLPDNHLAYAVQWFAFALIATAIYGLALRRRT